MKVLLGVGAGERAQPALERTVERALTADDSLTVAVLSAELSPDEVDALVTRARESIAAAGIDGSVRRVDGEPGPSLVQVAESEGFDQLVLGGGEQSPMGKIEVGTVAEYALLNSHVTVTLVR